MSNPGTSPAACACHAWKPALSRNPRAGLACHARPISLVASTESGSSMAMLEPMIWPWSVTAMKSSGRRRRIGSPMNITSSPRAKRYASSGPIRVPNR